MDSIRKDILDTLEERYMCFSKGQKIIADYILKNFDKAAYMTAAVLGETVGVSESTVVRFAFEMDFDGYPKLQKSLQDAIKNKLTSAQRIEVSAKRMNPENIIKSVLLSDVEKIKRTLEEIDNISFEAIVQKILEANRIYIIGVRSAAPLASFLGHYFNLILDNVRIIHTTDEGEMFEQLIKVHEHDLVIGISYPRYSKRTIKALEFVRRQGAIAVAITDTKESPIAEQADYTLTARSDMASFVDSLVAPLSLINALIVAVGLRRKNELFGTFEKLEKLWDEYGIYEKKT